MAQLSAERILNCTAEGVIIAVLAWLVLRAVGPQNSNTRFAVWFAALLGIATLPLFGNWASGGAGLAQRSEITMPGSWALYIFAAWLLLAAAGLLRVGIGFWHLHRLRKGCVPVDVAALDPVLRKTLEEFDSPRSVKLCVSDQLRVPTAIGFTNPLVVIPSWTMRELSAAELHPILLHELAHLRRRDDWTNLLQKILGALLFFHPAVWWIEKKLALEREMACDDMVLASATTPRAYAECLVALAEKSFLRRGIRPGAGRGGPAAERLAAGGADSGCQPLPGPRECGGRRRSWSAACRWSAWWLCPTRPPGWFRSRAAQLLIADQCEPPRF